MFVLLSKSRCLSEEGAVNVTFPILTIYFPPRDSGTGESLVTVRRGCHRHKCYFQPGDMSFRQMHSISILTPADTDWLLWEEDLKLLSRAELVSLLFDEVY